jgi:hypothetical protein
MNIDKNAVLRLRICGRAAFTICVSCDASAATVASATSARNAGRTCGVGSSMRLTVANSKANGGSHFGGPSAAADPVPVRDLRSPQPLD